MAQNAKPKLEPTVEADFTLAGPCTLERGGELSSVTLRYAVYGDLQKNRDRVILICHALSGSARVGDWWPELLGPGLPFDPNCYAILGINIIGSCYGSTGPTSINPATGRKYGPDFPLVTISDIVRTQAALLDHLGIKRLYAAVGGSIGGMQALNWALLFPDRIARAVAIGVAPLNALGLALNHLQRQSIWNDPAWNNGRYEQQPAKGLGAARALAMCSYKSGQLFDERYGRRPNRNGEDPFSSVTGRFDVAGYLDHQQEIFLDRFDANTYITITKLMDTWDVPAPGDTAYRRLAGHGIQVDLVGISSDWLFPAAGIRHLHDSLRREGIRSRYSELTSDHGHDGFLADSDRLAPVLYRALGDLPQEMPAAARFVLAAD
ncbi:MAG TPA: homoserine O-acetyltransferase [Terriglobales bacterium]|nr:homoserine O-acetyltransferase [Terriglobales bacterium]